MTDQNKSKFQLGTVTTTRFASFALERAGQKASEFLNLHKNCNWGEITPEEKLQNDQVVRSKDKSNKQILSAYVTSFNEIIWIVSKFDKNDTTTTILLPREYDHMFYK